MFMGPATNGIDPYCHTLSLHAALPICMTRKSNRADTLRPLVERGLSLREMAKATGWSRGAVSGVLFRAGLNAGKERPAWVQKGDLKNPAWRRAADLYLQGKSRAEIAEEIGRATRLNSSH